MYYIEQNITFQNGVEQSTYGFHYISRIQVDYVNAKTEIQISSSINKLEWANNNFASPFVNFYELDEVPNFDDDAINFALKILISKSGTVFHKCEVKKDYSMKRLIRL
jgi:hypothetical protein